MTYKKGAAALLAALCLLSACGGGGGPVWQTLPSPIVLTAEDYQSKFDVSGDGAVFHLECTVTGRGYWNQDSHAGVITRADIAATTEIFGTGLALGSIYGSPPVPRVEFWNHAGTPTGYSKTLPATEGPVLADGVAYSMTLETRADSVRYTMAGHDSGVVPTDTITPRMTGLAFARVGAAAGQLEFAGCRARWSAE